MNVKDSEHIIAELSDEYEITSDKSQADLMIINTCSVREKPVNKLFSEIGVLKKYKKPSAKLGICGCSASYLGQELMKNSAVDFVVGARNVSRIKEAILTNGVFTDIDYDDTTYIFKQYRQNKFKDFVNIMIGCDKECTYCIVPKTRGKELSIPLDIIIKTISDLVDDGVKEVTLLGQNVNNYGRRFSISHPKVNFTKLLQEVSKIDNLERIRFTSPHPLHADDEFLEEFANNPKICKYIHFPLQSGSNKILKLMKRGYTKEWFLDRVAKLRQIKDVTISTDVIVGFPYEEEEDFADTLDVVQKAGFEQMFSFVYSPRPLTKAQEYPLVDKQVAKNRLYRLQELQKEIMLSKTQDQIGKRHKVLFERYHQRKLFGKSDNFYSVEVQSDVDLSGQIADVMIVDARHSTLIGKI